MSDDVKIEHSNIKIKVPNNETKAAMMEANKIVRIARVLERTYEVFGTDCDVDKWLNSPNKALSGQPPLSLLDTDLGAESVLDALGRIEHGVFT